MHAGPVILFVDDQPERHEWFVAQLDDLARRQPGLGMAIDVIYAQSGPEALELLARTERPIGVAVVDLDFSKLPPDKALLGPDARREGLDIARRLLARAPALAIFLFTLSEGELEADEPQIHVVPADALIRRNIVNVALELLAQRDALERDRQLEHGLPPSLEGEPGLDTLRRLARSHVPLLLLGEPGTGKTELAAWLHAASARRGRFEKVDCAQWPGGDPSLMKAALFGQVKGVVVGAMERQGACDHARDGSLFLDEIGELPRELQGMLLRALDPPYEFCPLGAEDKPRRASFRLLSATNRSLDDLAAGMRRDLYHRLGAAHAITLLPLRERPGDVGWFCHQELARINAERARCELPRLHLDEAAVRALEEHPWPGNARELRLALETAAALVGDGTVLRHDHVARTSTPSSAPSSVASPAAIATPVAAAPALALSVGEPLDRVARRYLVSCWWHAGCDVTSAARLASTGRSSAWRAVRAAGLELLTRLRRGSDERSAALELGYPAEAAARLCAGTEDYLRHLRGRTIDVTAKADELGVPPEMLAALLAAPA
jgi:DNA-binding NtrC family response regulator